MTTDHKSTDGTRASQEVSDGGQRGAAWLERRRQDITLHKAVVEYSERPDRCTIYPPGLSSVARTSTWISADSTAWVSLSARR